MPFAIGAAVAIVGGAIGLFCTSLAHSLAQNDVAYALSLALGMTLFPLSLAAAIGTALPFTTLLLPAAYYATRSRWEVTPLRYALIGTGLATILVLPGLTGRIFGAPRAGLSPLIEQQTRFMSMGMSVGTILAGLVCGLLFGALVRGHYQRYRAALNDGGTTWRRRPKPS